MVCAICLDCGGRERLPCGHVFHSGCIHQWAERKETCPVCRLPFRNVRRERLLLSTSLSASFLLFMTFSLLLELDALGTWAGSMASKAGAAIALLGAISSAGLLATL